MATIVLVVAGWGCVGRSALHAPDPTSNLPSENVVADCSALTTLPVYVGVHGATTSSVRRFSYDPAGAMTADGTALLPDITVHTGFGTGIRGITSHPDGLILATDTEADPLTPFLETVTDDLGTVAPLRLVGGGARAVANVHTSCSLPNGNFIAAECCIATGSKANEYDRQGNFVRPVFTGAVDTGTLPDCTVTADGASVFLVDGNQPGDRVDVVRLDFLGDAWTEVSRFVMSDFDGGAGTGGWSITLQGDYLFLGPTYWDAAPGRINNLIRCPQSDLLAAGCETVGAPLPATMNFVESLAVVPCSDDLLVAALTGKIFRYDAVGGGFTELYDVKPDSPDFLAVRKARVVWP